MVATDNDDPAPLASRTSGRILSELWFRVGLTQEQTRIQRMDPERKRGASRPVTTKETGPTRRPYINLNVVLMVELVLIQCSM